MKRHDAKADARAQASTEPKPAVKPAMLTAEELKNAALRPLGAPFQRHDPAVQARSSKRCRAWSWGANTA